MALKHYILTAAQRAASGFSDLVVVRYSDITTVNDDAATDFAAFKLQAGDVVYPKTTLEVVTALAGTITGDTVKLSIGRTGSAYVDFLAASIISTTGTAAVAGVTYASAETLTADPIASDSTQVYVQGTITAGTTHLTTLTAGEWRFWLSISRRADRGMIQA